MYRVWNKQEEKWIKDNIYLSPYPHSDLYIAKKSFFGKVKLKLVSSERYIIHKYIGINDKNDVMIYEGDYLKAQVNKDKTVIGLVAYATEFASYIILCDETNEYFMLTSKASDNIEVIGNVFDIQKEEEAKNK